MEDYGGKLPLEKNSAFLENVLRAKQLDFHEFQQKKSRLKPGQDLVFCAIYF
jgi:hypothetical protein